MRAGTAVLLFFLAAPAGAASSSRVAVDARTELLGVVQYLSQERPDPVLDKAYQDDVERRFGKLRGHAAVRLYGRIARRPKGEGLGVVLLYFSAPPALKLERGGLHLPYVESEADRVLVSRFVWELRDFAAVSGFSAFFEEHRGFYRKVERAAAAELGTLDPAAVIERYLRIALETRNAYILSPLYKPGHSNSFILPYPEVDAVPERPKAPFEVYTLLSWVPEKSERGGERNSVFDVPSYTLWHEPLYVFIDPSFHHYEARAVPDPAKFYGTAAGCRTNDANCLKGFVVAALADRLSRRAWEATTPPAPLAPYAQALSTRLEEYEAGKEPLWEFYPRLFGVFFELAHPSAPAPALAAPGRPAASVYDFFDPAWRRDFTPAR